MSLFTNASTIALWQETLQHAEAACSIQLPPEVESYLIYLLMHYTTCPEIAKQVIAIDFLESIRCPQTKQRENALRTVGDRCLLLSGLFPGVAARRQVKVSYFVKLGCAAYRIISKQATDLYYLLAMQFVTLIDILQAMQGQINLLPLEAYEQWSELGSKRALKILQSYTTAIPLQNYTRN